jgi:glutaredoxin-like protein NrdH
MAEKVKLYALSTCGHCKRTKELLQSKGVDYDATDVDQLEGQERQEAIEEVKQYNPSLSFPTLVVGDKCVVGYKKDEIEEALQGHV